jgi:hypothetical protein
MAFLVGSSCSQRGLPVRSRRAFIALSLLLILTCGASNVFGDAAKDYDLKAVFLFNFAEFVEWPDSAFADANSPIAIGVFGDNPFGNSLEEAIRGETVHNRKLVVKQLREPAEASACQILFISDTDPKHLDQIFAVVRGKPVLTVGETKDFASQRGMIQFISKESKIRFIINRENVKAAGLSISSKLLKVAYEVIGTNSNNAPESAN